MKKLREAIYVLRLWVAFRLIGKGRWVKLQVNGEPGGILLGNPAGRFLALSMAEGVEAARERWKENEHESF